MSKIILSIFFTSFIPLVAPLFKVLLFKCCKKKYPPSILNVERKYAVILNSIFVTFTYGMVIPVLFIVSFISFMFQYVIDKYLLVYNYYKYVTLRSDSKVFTFLQITKYAPCILMIFTARVLRYNSCVFGKPAEDKLFMGQATVCPDWTGP